MSKQLWHKEIWVSLQTIFTIIIQESKKRKNQFIVTLILLSTNQSEIVKLKFLEVLKWIKHKKLTQTFTQLGLEVKVLIVQEQAMSLSLEELDLKKAKIDTTLEGLKILKSSK